MNNITLKLRNAISLMVLPLLVLAAACDQATTPSGADDALTSENLHVTSPFDLQNAGVNGNVAAQLAEVRRLTAPYHDHAAAADAGWSIPLSPCVEMPGVGGMGYHYGNWEYLMNGILDPLMPEVLLYEPQKNGKLRLVGVEYIVPFGPPEAEGEAPIEGDQPYLFGQDFVNSPHVGEHGAWTLHVWLWRNNPNGIFEDWNPKVSCDYADDEVEE